MTSNEFYSRANQALNFQFEEARCITKDRHSPDAEVLVGLVYVYGELPSGTVKRLKMQFPEAVVGTHMQKYGEGDAMRCVVGVRF